MSDNNGDPVERVLEVLVFAPLGAGVYVRDNAPSVLANLIARGRAEVDRQRAGMNERVTTVRSTGQMAMVVGLPKLRRRVEQRVNDARALADGVLSRGAPATEPAVAPPVTRPYVPLRSRPARPSLLRRRLPSPSPSPGVAAAASTAASAAMYAGDAPESNGLPIPGYDALSASQVVERLAGLGRDELDAVQAYESAHRQRRTILGKIEQLAG